MCRLLSGGKGADADLYYEADTWQESEIEIGNAKILLVTPRRADRCNCLCQVTLLKLLLLLLLLCWYLRLISSDRACWENQGMENSWNMLIINHSYPEIVV